MNRDGINNSADHLRWQWSAWFWVFFFAVAIFAAIPLTRAIQLYVYALLGMKFFMFFAVFFVVAAMASLLWLFAFKFRFRKVSQYLWVLLCASLYLYFIIKLNAYPEEAIHLLEYGLLSFFVFNALRYRVRDATLYVTTFFTVLFFGAIDEFLQWLMPGRYWDFRDIGINALGSALFLLLMAKGMRPHVATGPVRKSSVRILAGAVTLNAVFLGVCLSNTPAAVRRYTEAVPLLSWLRSEEAMTFLRSEYHRGSAGLALTSLSLHTVWIAITVLLLALWLGGELWIRRSAPE
ncbi:MAG: VanZ family protein [Nitrospiraceae bacterium]|nr:MAG: VanZ family protein [Nitrospiraceae bacterium]